MQPTRVNDTLSVAGQITREDVAAIAKAGFATIVNNRPDGEEPGQPGHAEIETEAKKYGLDYRYLPVVTSAITRRDVVATRNALARGPQPVLAHCRSGTRCYLLWAAAQVLYEGENALKLVAEAAQKGYDLRSLPGLVEKLSAEGGE